MPFQRLLGIEMFRPKLSALFHKGCYLNNAGIETETQLCSDASFKHDFKIILYFHIAWQTLRSCYDHSECHASQVSFFDCIYLFLTVLPARSLSLHFSKIVLLFPIHISSLSIPNCFSVHGPLRIFWHVIKFFTQSCLDYPFICVVSSDKQIPLAIFLWFVTVHLYSSFALCWVVLTFSSPFHWTGCTDCFKYFELWHVYMYNRTHNNSQRIKPWSAIYIYILFFLFLNFKKLV